MTHDFDGYTFTIRQNARFGPMKWYCGEIGLPNGGYDEPEDSAFRGFDLAISRDTGWWGFTYRGCLRGVLRSVRGDQRSRRWKTAAA